ncbi:class E sortase [Streptomyces sp. NPDC002328]|uniref:class E sortase n=1 Tax=Streptomyces sp. NPDC002328 TaxID=3364642 RepID=UPI0036997D39
MRRMRISVVEHGTRRRRARRRRVLWTGAELLVTVGVLGLLLVVHQLWWTNREAREGAERKVEALEKEWAGDGGGGRLDSGRADGDLGGSGDPGGSGGSNDSGPYGGSGGSGGSSGEGDTSSSGRDPAPSQAYAVLTVPRLGLRVPVAEGTSKRGVLDKGYAGHYSGTQQPGQKGNFALAGHRNSHGEPFRYLDRLRAKDTVEVRTAAGTYTYAVDLVLAQTSARDSGVLRPVPRSLVHPAYGFSRPGHYLTLTTCTPEYTSRYRLVVWATLVSTRLP